MNWLDESRRTSVVGSNWCGPLTMRTYPIRSSPATIGAWTLAFEGASPPPRGLVSLGSGSPGARRPQLPTSAALRFVVRSKVVGSKVTSSKAMSTSLGAL